jgi:hypothetical protein
MKCKNRILLFFVAIAVISCKSNQEETISLDKNNVKDSVPFNAVDNNKTKLNGTVSFPVQTNLMDSIAKIIYPCTVNDEIKFYAKNGSIKREKNNNLICRYESDLITMVTFYDNCKLVIRNIKSKTSCANSFVKYINNEIITYDSIDVNCKNIISYVGGMGMNDYLPEYLKEK